VRALAKFRQLRVGVNQIVAVTFWMRRGETNAFESVNLVDSVKELDESGFFRERRRLAGEVRVWLARRRRSQVPPAVACNDLAEQSYFLHAARNEFAAFIHDVINRAAAFFAARVGHDAKGAVLIAALHDADECADRFL